MNAPLRALIVDDETPARRRLRAFLDEEPDVEVAGEAADGLAAVEAITRLKPDLVFLDVQMPELDGFGVVRTVGAERMPATLFVTAFDHYALPAFESNAIDYLLKPFDQERLRRALARARSWLGRGPAQLRAVLDQLVEEGRYPDRFVVRVGERRQLLRVEQLEWVEAEGNYVRLHAAGTSYQLRESLSGIEARLDPRKFRRIHRSSIVNLDHILQFQPWFGGDYQVFMKDGTKLTLSRTYRSRMKDLI